LHYASGSSKDCRRFHRVTPSDIARCDASRDAGSRPSSEPVPGARRDHNENLESRCFLCLDCRPTPHMTSGCDRSSEAAVADQAELFDDIPVHLASRARPSLRIASALRRNYAGVPAWAGLLARPGSATKCDSCLRGDATTNSRGEHVEELRRPLRSGEKRVESKQLHRLCVSLPIARRRQDSATDFNARSVRSPAPAPLE
jgi:hypothetical protein